MAQSLLVPPKSRTRPDLSDLTGPNAYLYLATRDNRALGCIALRNMGTFGLVSAFRFVSDPALASLPDILIEQVETQARSLRLPVVRVWLDRRYPAQRLTLLRSDYVALNPAKGGDDMTLYEKVLRRSSTAPGREGTASSFTPTDTHG